MHVLCCSLLQAIGNGAVAQSVLWSPSSAFDSFLSINFGYALGLMVACYISIGVSGGHLNPAVTWAMAIRGRISWVKVTVLIVDFEFIIHVSCVMNVRKTCV